MKPSTGKEQLVLQLDIAEGEYKDLYGDLFAANIERNGNGRQSGTTADCFRQGFEGKQLPFFKGMISCIEESNVGYDMELGRKNA